MKPYQDSGPVKNEVLATIIIQGQIRGGKNNYIVTRQGRHIPKPEWAKWRDNAVMQVRSQIVTAYTTPIEVAIHYTAGDRRRRDQPAILDSIFHVLERAGVVSDDTLIWVTKSTRSYDKENPRAVIEILK